MVVQEGEHVLFGGHQKVNDEEAGRADPRPFGGRQVELWLLAQEIVEAAVLRQSQVVKGTRVVRVTGSHQSACVRRTGENTLTQLIEFFAFDDHDDNDGDEENETPDAKENGRTPPEADAASIFFCVVHDDQELGKQQWLSGREKKRKRKKLTKTTTTLVTIHHVMEDEPLVERVIEQWNALENVCFIGLYTIDLYNYGYLRIVVVVVVVVVAVVVVVVVVFFFFFFFFCFSCKAL